MGKRPKNKHKTKKSEYKKRQSVERASSRKVTVQESLSTRTEEVELEVKTQTHAHTVVMTCMSLDDGYKMQSAFIDKYSQI